MAWDFCADQDFEPTLDWVRSFVDDELRPIEPLLLDDSRAALMLVWAQTNRRKDRAEYD